MALKIRVKKTADIFGYPCWVVHRPAYGFNETDHIEWRANWREAMRAADRMIHPYGTPGGHLERRSW